MNSEISDAKKEQDTIAVKKKLFLEDRELMESELKEAEIAIQIATDEASNLHRKKGEILEIVTDIKVKLASSKERLESIKTQMKDKEGFITGIENRMIEKQATIVKGGGK